MMEEKIKYLSGAGAAFFPGASPRAVELANAAFQNMKASVLPAGAFADFYMARGGAVLGDSYVFPPEDLARPNRGYVIPGIVKINRDLSHVAVLRGKTVWGRNQLYLFSCDVGGAMYMHDVLTLQVLRKYNDFGAALTDCLLVGKI
ncbi:MAG: hypothetical protein LBL21_03380 [Rickettsiales bacterium]|jgi:hypothetical protein|nr:hypothetical protein [Rickettsiales bacterium]